MSSASPIKLITFDRLTLPFFIVRGLLGGCLLLISHSLSTPAQTLSNHELLAQQPAVYDGLPPQPPLETTSPINQEIPPLPINNQEYPVIQQHGTPPEYMKNQGYQEYPQVVPSIRDQQNSLNFERYLVVVDGNNYETLERIRLIEPTAYIRNFQGRAVIQAGIFSKASNAQQRVQELTNYGIYQAQVISFVDGQETPYNPNTNNPRSQKSHNYYVAIPASSTDIPAIADRIRSNIGQKVSVSAKNQPHGSHLAVGPFAKRSQAEEWNRYLHKLGFGNSRVYYQR